MMANKICSVAQGILEPDEGLTIELESAQWLEWLETHKSFRYCPISSSSPFTVTKEGEYWYGYRKQLGKLHKRYIGKSEKLTTAKLEEIASLLNIPSEPRSKNVEQPVTEQSVTSNSNDIAQLWQAVSQLRQEISALGKLESPVVEENSATGLENVDESILEELQAQLQKNRSQIEKLSSEIKALNHDNQELRKQLQTAQLELHKKVTNLSSQEYSQEYQQSEISRLEEKVRDLQETRDSFVNQKIEWYESLRENPVLKTQVVQLTEEISQLRSHSQQLLLENSELQKQIGNSIQPDIDSIRDRTLAKLKVGRQSTAGKAIDAFIKELRHVKTASTAASVADKASITPKTDDQTVTTTLEQKPPTWEARADDFLLEVASNG